MISSTPQSFWLDPPNTKRTPLVDVHHCDVAVIGAGICGMSCAYYLHRLDPSLRIAVVEGRGIGHSATGRNAGFILQGTAERYNRAISVMGREKARRIHAYSLENHRLMREVIQEHGLSCEYQRRGSLQLAGSLEEERELIESAHLLNEDGFSAEILNADQLGDTYTNAGFRVAVLLPEDGELHPVQFVRTVADTIESSTVRLFVHSPVLSIEEGDEVRLHTERGEIRSQMVLVCTNARIAQLLPWFSETVSPVRGQMLATTAAPLLFERPIYADHGYDYWRQTPQGNIVLGGWRNLDPDSEVGHDECLHTEIQQQMGEFLTRFHALRNVQITHRWAGIMGFSKDGLPILGAAPGTDGVLVGTGFTGHGFGFAWLAGKALATALIDGHHPFVEELHAGRFL